MTDRDLTTEEIDHLRKIRALHEKHERELAQEIGLFLFRFAHLEHELNWAIGRFLTLPSISADFLLAGAIQNTNIRINIFSSAVHASRMEDELRKKLDKCVIETGKLNDYRNWLAHDLFSPLTYSTEGENITTDFKWEKMKPKTTRRFKLLDQAFTPKEIEQRAKDCRPLADRINRYTRQYGAYRSQLHSSPEQSHE